MAVEFSYTSSAGRRVRPLELGSAHELPAPSPGAEHEIFVQAAALSVVTPSGSLIRLGPDLASEDGGQVVGYGKGSTIRLKAVGAEWWATAIVGPWSTENRGSLTVTLASATIAAAGFSENHGAAALTLDSVNVAAAGTSENRGALSSTLDDTTVVADGTVV